MLAAGLQDLTDFTSVGAATGLFVCGPSPLASLDGLGGVCHILEVVNAYP